MANKKKIYDKKEATKVLKEFIEVTNFDITDNSRKEPAPAFRSLLYTLLQQKCGLNDRNMSDFLKSKGLRKDRSSIFCSRTNFKDYLRNFKEIQKYYNHFYKPTVEVPTDDLARLINSIEDKDNRLEILELVELRVKSWAWKSKDKCLIVEGC
jgi:hypothetical protein